MTRTRVIYDGLEPGTHTWIFDEGPGEQAVCPEHGFRKQVKANADGTPRKDLPNVCDIVGADGACKKKLERRPCITVTGRPDVFPNDVIEVADLNDPNSHRASLARDAIERGLARVLKDGETAPAAAPAPPTS